MSFKSNASKFWQLVVNFYQIYFIQYFYENGRSIDKIVAIKNKQFWIWYYKSTIFLILGKSIMVLCCLRNYWTLLPNLIFYLIVQGFHRAHATSAACQQRTLTPPEYNPEK